MKFLFGIEYLVKVVIIIFCVGILYILVYVFVMIF